MSNHRLYRALGLGAVISVLLAACATGGELPGFGGGGSTSTGTGSTSTTSSMPEAGPSGTIGSVCHSNADCTEGTCAPIGNASYCTQACPPQCPYGTYCSIINGAALCVPDLDQQCTKCTGTTDCKLPSDACLKAPPGDMFCARDCTMDGLCPNGFTCLDKGMYQGTGDAGAPDGGGGPMDGGAGDAGDGGVVPPSAPSKWCVPNGGASCPCNAARDGVIHACSVKNQFGTCNGAEVCEGDEAKWKGCSAATPAAETCNGKDDDCNGMTDEGDPNALCAAMGAKPANANWTCKSGTCSLGACEPGWAAYPAGPATAGCACPLDPGEPNSACGTATPAGSVSDTGAPIMISGTLSAATDVDYWSIDTVDVDEVTTNSYHVSIKFITPAQNNEFVMDVMRGACADAPTGPSTNITSYDWCVNGTDGLPQPTGELTCGPMAAAHCGGTLTDPTSTSHTAKYFVRVYRKAGATGTCTQYQLSVSGGGGECDVSKKCP